jgi:class 3 adenylate cyclase
VLFWRSAKGQPCRRPVKLAAILAADLVGYSKLTGSDEEGTLARLRALRSEMIDPTVALHEIELHPVTARTG